MDTHRTRLWMQCSTRMYTNLEFLSPDEIFNSRWELHPWSSLIWNSDFLLRPIYKCVSGFASGSILTNKVLATHGLCIYSENGRIVLIIFVVFTYVMSICSYSVLKWCLPPNCILFVQNQISPSKHMPLSLILFSAPRCISLWGVSWQVLS